MPSLLATIVLILTLAKYDGVSATSFINDTTYHINSSYRSARPCQMTIDNRSIAYVRSRLAVEDLQFAHFSIHFNGSIKFNYTPDTFRPNQWVWTYSTQDGVNPFLYWNIDYTILSFGLLAAKTLKSYMFIMFNVPDNCNITFGTNETTWAIANAIRDATNESIESGFAMPKYEKSFYCYLAEAPKARDSISYQAAIYFMYPISYINYNCCVVEYNYVLGNVTTDCLKEQIEKWPQCTLGPFIIGFIMFLFYPILHFRVLAWIANDETVEPASSVQLLHSNVNQDNNEIETDDNDSEWLYFDGNTPYKLADLLTHSWCGLKEKWPRVIARIRRLLVVIAMPVGIYVQIAVYYFTFENDVKLLVKHGTPVGFLSVLGDPKERAHVFATVFGGPVGIMMLYFVISLLFIVVPRSVKQIYEDSIPPQHFGFRTPLSLSLTDIKRLAMVNEPLEPGYQNVICLLKCGIYMLFSKQFWKWFFKTQIERIFITRNQSFSKVAYVFKLITLPLYIVFCILEILICMILYGLPLCMWTVLIVRGAARSVREFRIPVYLMQFCGSSILRKVFLENYVLNGLAIVLLTGAVIIYIYVMCLIFIGTFNFLSQVIVFCLVAVIVYPSVAFGYLFFFVVLIYYIFHRIRDFGDGYLELLSDAVDISRNLEGQPNHISFYGDNMVISNVKAPRGINGIRINNTTIEVAANILNNTQNRQKFKIAKNKYGIPKDLFVFLVKRHRPAHKQALKIVFHIMLIIVLIGLTISISNKYVSGPSSEISEVMHVVFIVVVGALPRILELALTNASEHVKKEIKLRSIEQSVLEYWDVVMSME